MKNLSICDEIELQFWKKYYKVDGEVSQHLSPFEQNIVSPMFSNAHEKIFKRVSKYLMEGGPGIFVGYLVYIWAEEKHKEIAHHHRF